MTHRLQIILLILLVAAMAAIVNMVRRRTLELKYVLIWMLADVMLIVLVLFPGLINLLAAVLGIYSPMNMVFFMGFVLSLSIMFMLTAALSRVTMSARRMGQTIAILRMELQEMEKQQNLEKLQGAEEPENSEKQQKPEKLKNPEKL